MASSDWATHPSYFAASKFHGRVTAAAGSSSCLARPSHFLQLSSPPEVHPSVEFHKTVGVPIRQCRRKTISLCGRLFRGRLATPFEKHMILECMTRLDPIVAAERIAQERLALGTLRLDRPLNAKARKGIIRLDRIKINMSSAKRSSPASRVNAEEQLRARILWDAMVCLTGPRQSFAPQ